MLAINQSRTRAESSATSQQTARQRQRQRLELQNFIIRGVRIQDTTIKRFPWYVSKLYGI
jgi:hypothetical protein